MKPPVEGPWERPLLIVGGAGFVGANVAARALDAGIPVRVFDDFSRSGSRQNAAELESRYGADLDVFQGDVREPEELRKAIAGSASVIHCAGQVAVTSSYGAPREDFAVNAWGTLNLLEELRRSPRPLVFTSTNKVYGDLSDLPLAVEGERYVPGDPQRKGIREDQPLAFQSPYGCSKGAADQYVLEYARGFRVPATVFRMSCIYGPRQYGTEDQGWVAHFLRSALEGRAITIYGDGRQVRDLLYIDDLTEAVFSGLAHIHATAGRAFNIGGGPERAASPREILALIEELVGECPEVSFEDWRPGDQRYYASDVSSFATLTGWRPRVGIREGLAELYRWLTAEGARPARTEAETMKGLAQETARRSGSERAGRRITHGSSKP